MHLLTRIPTELEQFGTIPVELGPADARYRCEGVLVGRPGLGDGDEGRVGEDDVGRDLLLLSPLEAPRTKLLEQRCTDRTHTIEEATGPPRPASTWGAGQRQRDGQPPPGPGDADVEQPSL